MIPVFRPAFGEEEIDAVAEVMRSGWVGLGPKTAEFEQNFADFCSVPSAIAMNSCTAALDIAVRLLNLSPGDEVIVPTMTFVSTAHVVVQNLGTPIFADVDKRTLNIDPNDVASKITERTRAIIVTHYSGRPVDLDQIRNVASGLPIIEDCAHATGASYNGIPVGSIGDIGCFSFHAVKNLATGDGGMLTTKNQLWAKRAKSLRWLGIDQSTWDRSKIDQRYWWKYNVDEIGLKCHMNDIAAAIGLVQLQRISQLNSRRREIVQQYLTALSSVVEIELPIDDDDTYRSSWHLFCIRCERRDELSSFLSSRGISTGVHYAPIHQYNCYKTKVVLPIAEKAFERMLTLPLYPELKDSEVHTIIETILDFYNG